MAHEAEIVFRCETHSHKWGKMQGMKPNDSQVHSHFGSYTRARVYKCLEPWLEGQKNTKLGPHIPLERS
jgi:hypothetical protein